MVSPTDALEQRLVEVAQAAGAAEQELRHRIAELEEQLSIAARVRGVAEHQLLVRIRNLEEERDDWRQQCLTITRSRGYRLLEATRRAGLDRLSRPAP